MSRQPPILLTYILQGIAAVLAVVSLLNAAWAMELAFWGLWAINFGLAVVNIYLYITLGKARKAWNGTRPGRDK